MGGGGGGVAGGGGGQIFVFYIDSIVVTVSI